MDSISLEQYKAAVKEYAAKGVDYLFHNEGDKHALVIFSNIFCNAKSEIRIAANQLCNSEVVNQKEYIDSLRFFLDRKDTRLYILLTNRPCPEDVKTDCCLYKMLFEHPAYKEGRIVIKDGEGKSFRDNNGSTIHLCMGDNTMYRIENDVIGRKAIANFGDKNITTILNRGFDGVFCRVSATVNLADYYVSR